MRFTKLPLLVATFLTLGLAGCSSDDSPLPAGCAPGLDDCGGTCVDLQVDNLNCGTCGNPCGAFAGCSAAVCVPDATLNVGTFNYDFSDPGLTRGYWFTAPVAFTITGLRVPTDVGTEVQNIEVVKFPAAPPAFSAVTNSFTSLGRFVNVAGSNFVAVNIPVASGDIIGILGARGTTTMHNSYGQIAYVSSIKGSSVTLRRLGMQHNLNALPAQDLWTENSYIARIEMYYR